jgi:hypothetical protein
MAKKAKEPEAVVVPVTTTTVTATRLEDGTILDTVEAHELAAKKTAESDTRPEEVNNG